MALTKLHLEEYLEKLNEGIKNHHDYREGMRVYNVTRNPGSQELIIGRYF